MTPEQIAAHAESISLTPWYIAAEAALKFLNADVGSWVGFGWDSLQKVDAENYHALQQARSVLVRLDWHTDPWELNRTEIARVILEKVFSDDSL